MHRGTHFLHLGLAILLMSSSGTLARLIDLPAPVVIWARCVIGALALFLVIRLGGFGLSLGANKHLKSLIVSSVFLAAHWVTYFYSLQLSSVAIGMLSLFTYPVITALLEPLMLKTRLQKTSVFLGLLAFVGIAFLVPELTLQNDHTLGIVIGICSAILYSVRNIMLKKRVSDQSGVTLMFYQLVIVVIVLFPVIFFFDFKWDHLVFEKGIPLLILGLVTTAAGHTFFVLSFKHFNISTVSVISSATPLLGIGMGFVFLNEVPAGRTYIGGAIIFATVLIESMKSARRSSQD
ncbi:MAG: DMT family transporter [Cyclobacteriaceae bacterium]